MKWLLIILLFVSLPASSQINKDSLVKVEILQVWKDKKTGLTYVTLKNLETNKKAVTEGCTCEVPYKKRDTIWINRRVFNK